MAIDFPNSPSNGDIHTVSGKRWQWDGEKWQAYGASLAPDVLYVDQGNARVGINDTTPSYSLDVTGTAHVTGAITASGGVAGALTGNADTATALATARTIGGVSFDGTANIAVTLAATATALATARTIGGVSFDGTGNINLPGVNATGNQNTSGTAATVTGAAQSAITSLGTLTSLGITSGTDISPDSAGAGQFQVSGSGYMGFIAKDATAMHFGHNSSSRGLYLMTDETTRLAITGAGFVGIGNSAPVTALEIASDDDLTDFTSTSRGALTITNTDYASGDYQAIDFRYATNQPPSARVAAKITSSGSYLSFGTSNNYSLGVTNEAMVIDYTGKVGIGTTSPGEALHVVTASGAAYLKQYNGTATTYLGPDSSNTGLFGTSSAHDTRFITNNTERMRILAAGNVGIGTASPAHPLDVVGSSHTYIGILAGTNSSAGLRLRNDAHDWDLNCRTDDKFAVYSHTSAATRFVIDTSGNVGIGTETPSEQLHVYEAGTGNAWRGRAVFGGQTQVVVAGEYASKGVVGVHNTALNAWGDLILNYAGGGGGNVGIGTSSPANRLTVIATGNYSGSGTDNAAVHFKGAGDYGIAAAFDSDGSSDDIARIRYLNAGSNKWQVNYGDSIGWYSATWTERMVLTNAGHLSASGTIKAHSGDNNPVVIGTGNTANGGNIAIGNGTLVANSSGGNNLAIGVNALNDLTTSGWNVAIGNYALDQITTSGAQYNTAVGYEALSGGATGGGNVAMGFRAGDNITSGNNVIIGMQAHDIGAGNGHVVAVGYNAARNLNGSASVNVFVGPYTGYNVTSGVHDVMMGYAAGYGATTGVGNVIIGSECARTFTTAGSLTIIGYYAGYYTTGVDNVFLGAYAGHWNTTGVNNTGIGYYAGAGYPTTGNNNTFIGQSAKPLAADTHNSVTFGDANVSTLRCATTTISSLSDERDKTDIVDLDMGLDFIMRLRPRRFVWDDRHGGKVGIEDAGFVAQELQQAQADEGKTLPYLLLEENPDKLEASMGKLLPSMVLAIQELSDKVDALT